MSTDVNKRKKDWSVVLPSTTEIIFSSSASNPMPPIFSNRALAGIQHLISNHQLQPPNELVRLSFMRQLANNWSQCTWFRLELIAWSRLNFVRYQLGQRNLQYVRTVCFSYELMILLLRWTQQNFFFEHRGSYDSTWIQFVTVLNRTLFFIT